MVWLDKLLLLIHLKLFINFHPDHHTVFWFSLSSYSWFQGGVGFRATVPYYFALAGFVFTSYPKWLCWGQKAIRYSSCSIVVWAGTDMKIPCTYWVFTMLALSYCTVHSSAFFIFTLVTQGYGDYYAY